LTPAATPPPFDTSSALTFRLLVQETQRLSRDPFLADRFREGIDKGEGDAFRHFDLVRFADRVGLRPLERLVLAASILAYPPVARKEFENQAFNIVRVDFENAILSLCQGSSFDHGDITPQQVSKFLANLLSEHPLDEPVLDVTQRQALVAAAQAKYGNAIISPMLQQIFPSLRSVNLLLSRHRPLSPPQLAGWNNLGPNFGRLGSGYHK
jgi:CCR4-NOT transcription complex subunit 1